MQLPVLTGTIADIYTRIDGDVLVVPGVLDGNQSRGEGEILESQVMLQIAADVCTVQA